MNAIPTTELPSVEPETNIPDATIIRELGKLSRIQRHIDALLQWIEHNRSGLADVRWHLSADAGEVVIAGGILGSVSRERLREIAGRFPGEWHCGVPCVFGDDYLDWIAPREGITIRIQAAEKIAPSPVRPLIAVF